jgi:ATP-dependent RNA helicase DeaD
MRAGGLERYRTLALGLADEQGLADVAAAAIRLVHARQGWDRDEPNVPQPAPARPAPPRPVRKGGGPGHDVARLFVGAGRAQGIRPADLVGAITHETGLEGRVIGAIEITERFSLVELPTAVIDEVVRRLARARIKGRSVVIRRDRS